MKCPPSRSSLIRTCFAVCRRYWGNNQETVRKLGIRRGGEYVEGVHFKYPGRQIRALLSLISYPILFSVELGRESEPEPQPG
jgi:hypothetical protein